MADYIDKQMAIINMKKYKDGQNGSPYYHDWDENVLNTFDYPTYENGKYYELFVPVNPQSGRRSRNIYKIVFTENGIKVEACPSNTQMDKKISLREAIELSEYVNDFYARLIGGGFILTDGRNNG